jgi:hypothetical protein
MCLHALQHLNEGHVSGDLAHLAQREEPDPVRVLGVLCG